MKETTSFVSSDLKCRPLS